MLCLEELSKKTLKISLFYLKVPSAEQTDAGVSAESEPRIPSKLQKKVHIVWLFE